MCNILILAACYAFSFWVFISIGSGAELNQICQFDSKDYENFRLTACSARCISIKDNQNNNNNSNNESTSNSNTSKNFINSLQFLTSEEESKGEGERCQQQRQNHYQNEEIQNRWTIAKCFHHCYKAKEIGRELDVSALPIFLAKDIIKIPENLKLQFVCRDDWSLSFRIVEKNFNSTNNKSCGFHQSNTLSDTDNALYYIKISMAESPEHHHAVYLTRDRFFTVKNLTQNCVYSITAAAVYDNNSYSYIAQNEQFQTLPQSYTPGMVKGIDVLRFSRDRSNDQRLTASISWKPAEDMTCSYHILHYSADNLGHDFISFDVRSTQQIFEYCLENLTFSQKYEVGVRSKNTYNESKESEIFWRVFNTPNCLDFYNNDLTICPPPIPAGLKVKKYHLGGTEFEFNITWDQPKYFPDYYTVHMLDLAEGGKSYKEIVNGSSTSLYMKHVILTGAMYEMQLISHSIGGTARAYSGDFTNVLLVPDENHGKLIAVISVSLVCIILLVLTTFTIYHRRAKLKRYQQRCKYFEELDKKAPIDSNAVFEYSTKTLPILGGISEISPSALQKLTSQNFKDIDLDGIEDSMEINRDDIILYEVLGEGAFGLVRRGVYNDKEHGTREVAVKMLKEQPSTEDIRAFRREIEVMKSVERHPNIVGIIGHCTRGFNEMILLTEYCSFGNLLDFLRNEWKCLHELRQRQLNHNVPQPRDLGRKERRQHQNHAISIENIKHVCSTKDNFNKFSNINNITKVPNYKFIEKLKIKYNNVDCDPTIQVANVHAKNSESEEQKENPQELAGKEMRKKCKNSFVKVMQKQTENQTLRCDGVCYAVNNKTYGYEETIGVSSCKCLMSNTNIGCLECDNNDNAADGNNAASVKKLSENLKNISTGRNVIIKDNGKCGQLLKTNNEENDCRFREQNTNRTVTTIRNNVAVLNNSKVKVKAGITTKPTTLCYENRSYFGIQNDGCNKNTQQQQQVYADKQKQQQQPQQQQQKRLYRYKTDDVALNDENIELQQFQVLQKAPLSAVDLMDIARQVAVGMEFLAKNKVVHRDLAARNVLVAADRTIKIADFGLSRDVYQENIYKKTGNGKLPIKWLALESMTHQVYTTQSDVWSYGILLYEIVTLGGTPYPAMHASRLLHMLKTGYRMERPKHCGQEFYDLMHSCWHVSPGERPTFTEIIKTLDGFLSDENPQKHIKSVINEFDITTATRPKVQQTPTPGSDDAYLKPL